MAQGEHARAAFPLFSSQFALPVSLATRLWKLAFGRAEVWLMLCSTAYVAASLVAGARSPWRFCPSTAMVPPSQQLQQCMASAALHLRVSATALTVLALLGAAVDRMSPREPAAAAKFRCHTE